MVNYAISKNIHVETEKEHFSARFLFNESSFLGIKNQFSPLFQVRSSWNFFWWDFKWFGLGIFFGFLIPMKFDRLHKIFRIQKIERFCKVLSILLLQAEVFGILKKKKRPFRLGPCSHRKHFSSNWWNLWICWGGGAKLFTYKSLQVHEDKLRVHDNFCSTIRGRSILKLSRTFVCSFLRNAGKARSP